LLIHVIPISMEGTNLCYCSRLLFTYSACVFLQRTEVVTGECLRSVSLVCRHSSKAMLCLRLRFLETHCCASVSFGIHPIDGYYRVGHKSLTTLCKSQSMRNRWITTICDLIRPRGNSLWPPTKWRPSRSPHLWTFRQTEY
jgi:hypothetical protein